jgi:hypothetical protein
MLTAPAFCSNCNSFSVVTLPFTGNMEVTLENVRTSCPKCEKPTAKIFDGKYTTKLIEAVLGIAPTKSDYEGFNKIVVDAKRKDASAREVSEAIEKEVPKLSPLTTFLKYDFGLIPILSLMVAVIGLIYTITQNNAKTPTVEEIIKALKSTQPTLQTNVSRNQKKTTKTKPNDPCVCGTGKKYKKCCQYKER